MDSNTRCEPRCDGKILKRFWQIVSISLIRPDTGSRIGIVAGIFFGKVMAEQENSYVLFGRYMCYEN